jgi:hypothetical protein
MRTILIPTDFTSVPLLLLKHAATHLPGKLDVIFMYSTFLPNSISELLFYSPTRTIERATNKDFSEGCSIILNRYPEKFGNIRYEVLHGNNVNAFKALAQANHVDTALLPFHYNHSLKGGAFDPTPLILKSDVQLRMVDLQLTDRFAEDLIASLLMN